MSINMFSNKSKSRKNISNSWRTSDKNKENKIKSINYEQKKEENAQKNYNNKIQLHKFSDFKQLLRNAQKK